MPLKAQDGERLVTDRFRNAVRTYLQDREILPQIFYTLMMGAVYAALFRTKGRKPGTKGRR